MQCRSRSRRKSAGSVLLDALIGLFIVGMGAVAYYSMLPVIHRGSEISKEESKAAHIAGRVIEQLAMLKPSEVNASTLKQLNLIDADNGSQPWSFSNIPLDDGTAYSPAKSLRNGKGWLTTTTLYHGSVRITLTITWNSPTGHAKTLTTGTIVGGYR